MDYVLLISGPMIPVGIELSRCRRCGGRLCRDNMFDLPRRYREYYCMNCGERFWFHPRELLQPASRN